GEVVDDGEGNLGYSVDVPTADLIADNSVKASVTATDAAGNSQTATETHEVTVDAEIAVGITIDTIAGDDVINTAEAEQNFTAVTGTVSGDVVAGDQVTVSVNGNSYTANVVDDGAGNLSYSTTVATVDLIADNSVEASVTATDAAGNSQTATETREVTVNTDASAT
ncbi:Ig-like domain-containing protein, partial [Vreelandella alkaliphila]|uniref:Ig-like domain-containing protein n=1 Tax=Vreelandella alkaliphila TaxID=272774 RepID=UPI003FD7D5B1